MNPTGAAPLPSFDQDTLAKIQQAQAAGYNANDIIAKASEYQAAKAKQVSIPSAPAQPQQPQDLGSMLRDLLPTIGGVGGSLLGLPFGGVGAIGGGAVGSGLGEYIRQLLTPNEQQNPGNVVKEAALGGAGGLAGNILGPLFKFGGRFLPELLPNTLDRAGTGFVASQFNVPRSAARALDLNGTIEALGKYGINNIDNIVPAAEQVTGANGVISKLTRKAVAQAAPVDVTGIDSLAKDVVSNPAISSGKEGKFMEFVHKGLQTMLGGRQGQLGPNANPEEVFSFIQQLEKQASQIDRIPVFQRTGEDIALKTSYKQLAEELKLRLFEGRNATGDIVGPGADKVLATGLAGPEDLIGLHQIHPELATDVANAKTIGDLRRIAAPFVKGSQLASETEAGSQIGFNNAAGAVKGVGKLIQNPLNVAAVPLSSNTVNAGLGAGAQNAADILRGLPKSPDWLNTLIGRITGQGVTQAAGNIAPQQAEASMIPGGEDMSGMGAATPQDKLRQTLGVLLLSRARSAGDLKDAFSLISPNSNIKPLTAQQQILQGNAQSGLRALSIVEQQLQSDPNSPFKANIPIIGQRTPYAAAAREISDVVTRLRTGAALNKDEQAFYQSQLPQPFDSPETIQYKLSLFRNLFNKFATGQTPATVENSVTNY